MGRRKMTPLAKEKARLKRERIKIRIRIRAERRQQKQDEKDERMYVRWLLFCKGRGQAKKLNTKDALFINHHVHKTYDRYLMALQLGIDNRVRRFNKPLKRDPAHPPPFRAYRILWYGRAKAVYIHSDVPKLMKMRWEEFQSASRNTEVPQQPAGKWMSELQREISQREPGELGVSVSELPGGVRSNQGRYQGQKQIRERREEETGSNRDAATVGT